MSRTEITYREVNYQCDICEGATVFTVKPHDKEPETPLGWLIVQTKESSYDRLSEKINVYHFCSSCKNKFHKWLLGRL